MADNHSMRPRETHDRTADGATPAHPAADEMFGDPLPIRRQVDRFQLIKRLGNGSFGEVWSALDESGSAVAIKLTSGAIAEGQLTQVIRELKATMELSHPHIARVREIGRLGEGAFIVSDLVEGVALDEWRSTHSPTACQTLAACKKLAEVLHHAHEKGVIHRDLKPSNILMDAQSQPFLVDFGLAANEACDAMERYQAMRHSLKAKKRSNGATVRIMGTPTYMSPEQAGGQAHRVDRRSDVYSLGVIMYELLTGKRPFEGTTAQLIRDIQYRTPRRPRRFDRKITPAAELICLKAMAKDPTLRYACAQSMADDCALACAGEPVPLRFKLTPSLHWPYLGWTVVN